MKKSTTTTPKRSRSPETERKSAPFKKKGTSRCKFSGRCGGCTMIDTPMEEQLRAKQLLVEECIGEFGPVEPVIRMKNPGRYRNKVTSIFGPDRKGRPVCGVYRQHSHEIVPVTDCLIENKRAGVIVQTIYSMLPSFKIRVYDEKTGFGLLRAVQIRTARTTGQIMVTIVTNGPAFPSKNHFVQALLQKHPEITTIVQNINSRATTMVLGTTEKIIYGPGYIEDYGPGYIEDELCGKRFRISSRAFYQVNSLQTEKLYRIAIDCAGLSGKERVIDTYCGIGTIGICAADKAAEVIGVELNPDAVKNAVMNAGLNGLQNVRFYNDDSGSFMEDLARNPPRSGASDEFLQSLLVLSPKKIVYVSCNPVTLGENLAVLVDAGYCMKKAVPVDMFPFTEGIETVCLLSKLHEAKHHINVKVDMDELDLTSAEAKATYKEIEEWVQEHYGFHVTNLNIAQVKQKHGIIERENYNKPKSENSRQPGCPEEKVKAIEDALRHFQMI